MGLRRGLGVMAMFLGAAIALAGGFAAWATWGLMATYADPVPNTLFQNLSPLLFLVPAAGLGSVLVGIGRKLWRRADIN